MGIQARISGCSRKLFVVFVGNMSSSPRVFVSLCKTEINEVNNMLLFTQPDQKVIRFYVSMQKPVLMDKLYALQHLDGKHEHSFVRKLLTTVFVEIFERGSK